MIGSPGSVITRGLGSPLLMTRGYGGAVDVLVIEELVIPPPTPGGRSSRSRGVEDPHVCYTVRAQLIRVNGIQEDDPVEHLSKVCFDPTAPRPSARIVDTSVTLGPTGISVMAELSHIQTGSQGTVRAQLTGQKESPVIVKARLGEGGNQERDVFIAVKKITMRDTDES